jgi:hypothetical protein
MAKIAGARVLANFAIYLPWGGAAKNLDLGELPRHTAENLRLRAQNDTLESPVGYFGMPLLDDD